jgi:general L-amino acid transport system permease protein
VILVLLRGGLFGLAIVAPNQWSGLPLTILLSVATFALALPLGVILALARCGHVRSIRTISIVVIESIRGVPLISLLFMASVMSPMILPEWAAHNAILIAQFPITIFISVYIAETVRAGLLAIPATQIDAAASLGLDYWRTTLLVVLPQAISTVVGPLVALFIAFFQDTTLVGLVGLMDFLSTIRAALHDPKWQGVATVEAYLLAGLVYLMCSVALGLYGRFLERTIGRDKGVTQDRTSTINVI